MVEVLVALGESDAAMSELDAIEAEMAGSPEVLEMVRIRNAALQGKFDAPAGEVLPASAGAEDEVVEIEIEAEEADQADAESRGDALMSAGDLQGAMAAYQQALAEDPTNEEVLMKLGELVAGEGANEGADAGADEGADEGAAQDAAAEPADLPAEALAPVESPDDEAADSDMPDFKSIFKGAASPAPASAPAAPPAAPPAVAAGDDALGEARARLMVGLYEEAAQCLDGRGDLLSATVRGEALMYCGKAADGRKPLRRALDDAAETDAGYTEALWILARLQAIAGRGKAAVRTLDDLADLEPGYRAVEVAALRGGITLLKGR